jgi:hypothetical protein
MAASFAAALEYDATAVALPLSMKCQTKIDISGVS